MSEYGKKLKRLILGLGLIASSVFIGLPILLGTEITSEFIIVKSMPGLMGLLGYFMLEALEEKLTLSRGSDEQ